jgi:hypothetical protein
LVISFLAHDFWQRVMGQPTGTQWGLIEYWNKTVWKPGPGGCRALSHKKLSPGTLAVT